MKQNDLDYIKDKLNHSGIAAPDSLDDRAVYERLRDVTPVKEVKKPQKKWVAHVSAAAALALITATAFGLNAFLSHLSLARQRQALGLDTIEDYEGLQAFSSRSAVLDAVERVRKLSTPQAFYGNSSSGFFTDLFESRKNADIAEDSFAYESAAGSSTGNALTGASDFGGTYLQYGDVDEADTVKTDGRYIYCLTNDGFEDFASVEIFDANPKKPDRVAEIKLDRHSYDAEIYISGNRLTAVGTGNVSGGSYEVAMTQVSLYDISDIENIRLIESFSQGGDYVSSRMIDDTLYVVSDEQYLENYGDVPIVTQREATEDEATVRELDPGCIYAPARPTQDSFLIISRIDTKISAMATETKAILGAAGTVYCNGSNLYVLASSYNPEVYEMLLTEPDGGVLDNRYYNRVQNGFYSFTDYTRITKISLGETMEFVADGMVSGEVLNQYALDEKDSNLRIATTSYNDEGKQVNNLFVLDGQLKELGSVTGFAENESIKAVRYVGNTAYVITYEQTDPLFVIDTADPHSPKLLGEVKISGFSSMLVPVDDNTLLGIGYHTVDEPDDYTDMEIQEGLKLVLFDVSDKANPRVLDTKVFEGYSSAVQYNPKALLVNPQRGEYTLPYSYYHWVESDVLADGDEYASAGWMEEQKSGVISFVVENGKIAIRQETAVFDEKNPEVDNAVDRCVYVDDTLYLIESLFSGDSHGIAVEALPYR